MAVLPMWARALAIAVGLFSLGAAAVVLLFPGVALLTLVAILGIAFVFLGIDRLAAGITGHPHRWMPVASSTSMAPADVGSGPKSPL